jgi:hypothetical protein
VTSPITPPRFDAQVPGADGSAALVTITATSTIPNASVGVALLTPANGQLVGHAARVRGGAVWNAGQSWAVPIMNGSARAAEIFVYSGNTLISQKRLLLPPAEGQAVTSLQNADPYFALQQVAGRTGQPILVDSGLATPVTLDLTNVAPQQAIDQAITQIGARRDTTPHGVLNLSRTR